MAYVAVDQGETPRESPPNSARPLIAYEILRPGAADDGTFDSQTVEDIVVALRNLDKSSVGVETESVYGAAVLIPQIARTCGWREELLALTFASYVYLILCVIVHGALLVYMQKSDEVTDGFGGQMYLCDFGAWVDNCKEGDPACLGPGGTTMSPPRMYSWGQWVTRNYVRDALMAVFPDDQDKIHNSVDPGEYGLESYSCRLLCVFVFLMSVIQELFLIVKMVRLFTHIPTENQPWLTINKGDSKDGEQGGLSMDKVQIKVAGMSIYWKIFNGLTVVLPKVVLWILTVDTGVSFLMETAGTDDIIVNSVALGFLLTMDETVVALMSAQTRHFLERCEDYELPEQPDDAGPSKVVEEKPLYLRVWNALCIFVGYSCFKLLLTISLTALFTIHYYNRHCTYVDGRWVSKPVYTPASTSFNFLNAVFPGIWEIEKSEEPYWTMPEASPS
eukprot:TRINITY_DN1246_c1_g2_i1.p1 TRINITY_DN1246_c1_g2~~TRINITY_DN1246_c1_g2_i1.p1  ORF type:complete len:447 (+),score=67.84 TRINITY_DN1246_c1_g2_i1:120-1460(+)